MLSDGSAQTNSARTPDSRSGCVLVLFLLGAVYVVFVAALFAAGVGAALMAVIAVVLLLVQLFASDKIALAAMGAKEVSPDQAPELHAMIERLCVQADLPKPRGRVDGDPDAERVRDGALAEERHRVRDHGHPRHALARPSSRA